MGFVEGVMVNRIADLTWKTEELKWLGGDDGSNAWGLSWVCFFSKFDCVHYRNRVILGPTM